MIHPKRVALAAGAVVAVALTTFYVITPLLGRVLVAHVLGSLPQVPLPSGTLDSPQRNGRLTVLVIVSDARVTALLDDPHGGRLTGERADAVILFVVDRDGSTQALSLPRDLRVAVQGHADQKLGGALPYGAAAMVAAVRRVSGLPVNHFVRLDARAFEAIVDAVGGIDLALPYAIRDHVTKLRLAAGFEHLAGRSALAYARARHAQEYRDGRWIDVSGDLPRLLRQQEVLAAVAGRADGLTGLTGLITLVRQIGATVLVDNGLATDGARLLAAVTNARGAHMLLCTLPTRTLSADSGWSPFPPQHLGTIGFLEPDAVAAPAVIRAVAGPATRQPPPAQCRTFGSRT